MTTIKLDNVYILDTYTTGGAMESKSPLNFFIDELYPDNYCLQSTYEKAEQYLLSRAILGCFKKTNLTSNDIDLAVGGDLLNQIVSCNYVMRDFDIPFLGTYGACSSSSLALITGAMFIKAQSANKVLAFTSSHNNAVERQFRYPNEYGAQKKSFSTFTTTGAAALILTNQKTKVRVSSVTFGRVVDYGLNDPADLGSAMTPAAYDTFKRHLMALNIEANYYDLIVTGDLSKVGSKLFKHLAANDGIYLENYNDCGLMLYDLEKQNVFSGGSGCACAGLVSYGYIYRNLLKGKFRRVLVIATGALFSSTILNQKETIPGIAHAYALEVEE